MLISLCHPQPDRDVLDPVLHEEGDDVPPGEPVRHEHVPHTVTQLLNLPANNSS